MNLKFIRYKIPNIFKIIIVLFLSINQLLANLYLPYTTYYDIRYLRQTYEKANLDNFLNDTTNTNRHYGEFTGSLALIVIPSAGIATVKVSKNLKAGLNKVQNKPQIINANNYKEYLNVEQINNIKRAIKKIPANSKNNIEIYKTTNDNIVFKATSSGKVPDSKAEYIKTIDKNGKTISYNKITYDPKGNIIHNKDKFNVIK
ncbi:hypothetical protein [Campylobacter ureolyticus]|uniref:Uncharacterized protein n=1 Tax=Campylobacter ureolyticus TaxID=827 RepID=A0A9Q4KMI8_9BACT|nr:hypothetical protein [Campylobacter ureolyticus]MCZ6104405.1 hypothetical protein [Campylobacter ureolyticus]MCZ6135628.1 hypothetical protein [Campylobacter ureolyticus]MCZ6162378.1 hypothetical protein [Campylobacter ureolyticus]MCZ6171387.1 hypothetical protein [Campylobacter ureolyticus]MDU4982506.1 hypothetical protein [Campylobacter ureolyticus]